VIFLRTNTIVGRWKLELIFRGYFLVEIFFFIQKFWLKFERERDVFVFFRLQMLIGLCGVATELGVREAVIEKDSGIFRIFYCIFFEF
jgi:hypothetical protein